MPILRKPGRCCECGGPIAGGAEIVWVSKEWQHRHPGNGVAVNRSDVYRPRHANSNDCVAQYVKNEMGILKQRCPETHASILEYINTAPSKKELRNFLNALPVECQPSTNWEISEYYGK